ncbi:MULTISPECIES: GntR family transcriptional regulator [Klebsiella]|uniref:GntR family transcriptional regulator n=1 Tax=Klebsiella TaxID=570 RepID=UPI0006651346|nr:GntR family transcriptional regulator [Klebsiella michiganensis]MBZ7467761.1 GntR family transcriptional regulator [Klebsiella grimontii]
MIYMLIAQRLRERINSEEFQRGDALPGELLLAQEIGVSRSTLRKAINILAGEGMLERRHGSGTYILQKDLQHDAYGLNSFAEHMQQIEREVRNEVVQFCIRPAPPAIARQLRIKVNDQVYYFQRIRHVDGKPYIVEDSYMPVWLFPTLSLHYMRGSKFDYIESQCGITIDSCIETFTPVLATTPYAHQLKIKEGALLLQLTSLTLSTGGKYLDFSVMYMNPSEYQVKYRIKRNKIL